MYVSNTHIWEHSSSSEPTHAPIAPQAKEKSLFILSSTRTLKSWSIQTEKKNPNRPKSWSKVARGFGVWCFERHTKSALVLEKNLLLHENLIISLVTDVY